MHYYTIPPPSHLAQYVRCFWVLESDMSDHNPFIYRSMADGCTELIFHYKGRFDEIMRDDTTEKSFISGIHGQSQHFRRFITCESFGIFGVYVYPFALPKLFSLAATDVSDQMPDLASVLGSTGRELGEKMMEAPSNTERKEIITAFLEQRLCKNKIHYPNVFAAIQHIIQTKGLITVDTLSKKYYLSTRQFERKFKEFSGFNPKLFSRIIRFQSALTEYTNKEKSLTAIAYDCGYYDQSHFIHDFKQFSGHHPKEYFSGSAEAAAWRDS
ncbi:MAG: helix-turn-helix transcriptional regulator [Chitinophagales bacterium]|nr:helix-turn-helix transcriptional regulator [Chitinophagales bacterium]